MTRLLARWLPAVVVPAVIAAGAVVGAFQAGAAVNLPAKTPEQVLTLASQSRVHDLSGTLVQTSELGLPQLPTGGPSSNAAASSALDLLTGSHTARIFLDGPTNARVQVMDQLAERDVVRHGTEVWLYSSKDNAATHITLPARADSKGDVAEGTVQTPAGLAQRLLAAIDPSTQVSVGRNTQVAGRAAYDLVLTPRASGTLIGSVSIAVDAETGLPLSVEVQARGQDKPAFQLGFTALTLQAPEASLFTFVPPPGATVKEQAPMQHPDRLHPDQGQVPAKSGAHTARPFSVSGSGWDAVIELPAATLPPDLTASPLLAQTMRTVPGGRLLSTALVNVLLTSDGRVFAGSVPLERLQAAAGGGG
ncbi:MAG: hypothetical protein M3017_08115 [Actinomycetota bacterium]|nr:hypothetical protein [Actinomycetota bacterium]